jgi:hypothetical protein
LGSAPVSRLLERLTDVPLKLKERNNVGEIEVDFKWMFSLVWCGFIRSIILVKSQPQWKSHHTIRLNTVCPSLHKDLTGLIPRSGASSN